MAKAVQRWFKLLAREGVDITTISLIDTVFFDLLQQFQGRSEGYFFTHLSERTLTHYTAAEPHAWGRWAYQKYFPSPGAIAGYYRKGRRLERDIKKTSDSWRKKGASLRNLQEAFRVFRSEFEEIGPIYSITSWLAIEAWQQDFEACISHLIVRHHLEAKRAAILEAITKPWRRTALVELQERLAKGESPALLARKFDFLGSWVAVWRKPLDQEWMRSIANNDAPRHSLLSFRRAIEILQPNAKERGLLELAPHMFFFKDWRDDLRRRHGQAWSFLFDRIAGRYGCERDDLGYLTLDELELMLSIDELPKEHIEQRKHSHCIITEDERGRIKVIEHPPQHYLIIIEKISREEKPRTVAGLVASPGITRGKVRIVRTRNDLKLVRKGEILVANSTHPEYLPAMQRAAAFVTNEGGLASHAAIVAREMRKPCIVGLKNATGLFKDGDLVEVDAVKGVMRRV